MAGDWLKFEVNTPEKPEVLAITIELGWDDPDLTVGKLLRVWRWFDQHTEEGNAANVTTALLDRIVGVTGFCQAMANVGWLVIDECGISLPNFDRHNGKTAKNRSLTAKRVANHKSNAKANAQGNGASVTNALPREEKRREEVINTLSGKPDAEHADLMQAKEAIDYLNEKTNSGFQKVETNLRMVRARLAEGFSIEVVKSVIDRQVERWGSDPKMSEYLRPKTLFAASNFASYAGQITAKRSDWWTQAGFDSAFDAENHGCNANTAYQWRNRQRVEVPA